MLDITTWISGQVLPPGWRLLIEPATVTLPTYEAVVMDGEGRKVGIVFAPVDRRDRNVIWRDIYNQEGVSHSAVAAVRDVVDRALAATAAEKAAKARQ